MFRNTGANAFAKNQTRLAYEDKRDLYCKTMIIPRLELSAAALSVPVDNLLRKEISIIIDMSVLWADSTAVLKFIHRNDRIFQTFVANRISVINDDSDSQSWNYVDSKSSPADAASRGVKADDLLENDQCSQRINGHHYQCLLISPMITQM